MAAIDNLNELILSGFKKGSTIDQLTAMYINLEKKTGRKILRWDARRKVEQVLLDDYLKLIKSETQGAM